MAKIIVVDDEANMRFLLRTTLEMAGHDVAEAPDGVAAVAQIEGGKRPDLVTTDFMMPRMNGGELIARLRRDPSTSEIPIILLSSSPGSENRTEANMFFRKPFDPDAFIACVETLLEKSA
ncbi:MAG TPA: response regulator [Gaiellaceae bacterium]|nr:response regulator [Gaiellaceae bacterium]